MSNETTPGDGYQPWQNAPSFVQIAASQQGGSRGAQLWGLTLNGQMRTIYQETPGGSWSGWLGPDWNGNPQPAPFVDSAAAQQNNGNVQLWALDSKLGLWTTGQTSPGGNWTAWSGPGWNSAPRLDNIGASQQGGSRGAQLWGSNHDAGGLATTFQETPGGSWSGWGQWPDMGSVIDVSAAQQNDGRVQLWVIDDQSQLWSCWQTSPGGGWTGWSGPNWNGSPAFFNIEAVQQGGSRGAQVWGITRDYTLMTSYQESPGGGWSGWFAWPYPNTPQVIEMAAAQQNDGRVQLWVITSDGVLISTYQTSPGGNWTNWNQ
ncbi:MAG TPA: hypothetical protein VN228_04235 [Pyrinomonadaceae bacterium]|nr:hypothetical protein [Pyrinomonadaceae bacterium]